MNGKGKRAKARIGADIAGRFFPADVLFARRKRQHVAPPPGLVNGLTDQSARHLAQVFLTHRQQANRRATEVERVAKRLPLAGDDIGAHGAGGFDDTQGHGLGDHGDEKGAFRVTGIGERAEVMKMAVKTRILDDQAGCLAVNETGQVFSSLPIRRGGDDVEDAKLSA